MAQKFLFHFATLLIFQVTWPANHGAIVNYNNPPVYERQQIIIDVDAGADDAMAMLMLLSPKAFSERGINVIAITCVNGNTVLDNVVVNVLKTLKTAGRLDIPVFRGASKPLQCETSTDSYFGQDGFGDFYYPDEPNPGDYLQREHAVNALIRMVSQNPGQITLVALAPLTNIALAIKMYPNFLRELKRLIVLGGSVKGVGNVRPGVEFNFYIDPEAANIVLASAKDPICLVPWETVKIASPVSMKWRKEVLGNVESPAVDLLNNAEKIYNRTDDQWINADSFAALLAIRRDSSSLGHTNSFCGGRPVYAEVVVECDGPGGAVMVDYANNLKREPNIEIIEKFHTTIYKNTLLSYLGKQY